MERKCKWCEKDLIGKQKLFCCSNHKRYSFRRDKDKLIYQLKELLNKADTSLDEIKAFIYENK